MKPQGSNLNKLGSKYSPAPDLCNEVLFKMGVTDGNGSAMIIDQDM